MGWTLSSSPEITANWIANGNKWTVPVGGVSKVVRFQAWSREPTFSRLGWFDGTIGSAEDLREVISAYQKCIAETVQRSGIVRDRPGAAFGLMHCSKPFELHTG